MLGITLAIIPVSFEILFDADPGLVTIEGISVGFINMIGIFRIKCLVGSVIGLRAAGILLTAFYQIMKTCDLVVSESPIAQIDMLSDFSLR